MGEGIEPPRAGSVLLSPRLETPGIEEWGHRLGYRLVRLPEPGHRVHPDIDSAGRRRLGRHDAAELAALLWSLRTELTPDAGIVAFLVADEDVSGQAGRAWLRRVTDAANRVALDLPRPARFASGSAFDPERLERRILAD